MGPSGRDEHVARGEEPDIVLVIPERRLRTALRGKLLEHGHGATAVADLGKLLALVRERPVAMIVVDRLALTRAGLEAIELVHSRLPDVPIVLLTRRAIGRTPGPWNATVQASSSSDDVVATIEWLLPLAMGRFALPS